MATTKARREAAALFFVVFLLGVLLGGVGVHLWGERVLGETKPVNTNPNRAQVIAQCTHELQLTPDQQKQMIAIIDDTRAKWAALYAPLDPQKEQIRLRRPRAYSRDPYAGAAGEIRRLHAAHRRAAEEGRRAPGGSRALAERPLRCCTRSRRAHPANLHGRALDDKTGSLQHQDG